MWVCLAIEDDVWCDSATMFIYKCLYILLLWWVPMERWNVQWSDCTYTVLGSQRERMLWKYCAREYQGGGMPSGAHHDLARKNGTSSGSLHYCCRLQLCFRQQIFFFTHFEKRIRSRCCACSPQWSVTAIPHISIPMKTWDLYRIGITTW